MAHLINTTLQLQEFVNVGSGLDISSIRPGMNEVEMQELTFYLGADLLAEVIAQVNSDPVSFTPRIEKIKDYVVAACAGLSVFKAGPELEVIVNSNGILRHETNTEKTAFGGQVKRFRDMAADRGYKAIDSFLRILEAYTQDYPEWLESEYYALRKGLLITSVQEFEQAGESIKGSALTFQALRSLILDVQEQRIRPSLTEGMYANMLSDDVSEANKLILKNYIRPAMAKLVIDEALTSLPVDIDHEGVTVNQIELISDSRTKTTAPIHLIEKKSWGLRSRGEYYLSLMKEFLNKNASASAYADWFASEHYAETLAAQIQRDSLPAHERRIYRA